MIESSGWTVHRRYVVMMLFAVAALCMGACGDDSDTTDEGATVMHFDTARMRLVHDADTLRLATELAMTSEQRTLGLMERHHLADSAGMLFVYPAMQSDSSAFWMFRTRIPLDIAFIDSAGTVRSIKHMQPCTALLPQGCPTYPAEARFLAALEVNAGYFDKHGVRVGDRVILSDSAVRMAR